MALFRNFTFMYRNFTHELVAKLMWCCSFQCSITVILLTMIISQYRWFIAGYAVPSALNFPSYKRCCLQYNVRRLSILSSTTVQDHVDIQDVDASMPVEFKSGFLTTMRDRGFIHQCTDFNTLDYKFSSGIVTAYLGTIKATYYDLSP